MNNLIDSISLRIDILSLEQYNSLVNLLNEKYRNTLTASIKADSPDMYYCKINNMKVSLNIRHLFISGSINKFHLGNNVDQMKYEDVYKVIDSLNQSFGNLVNVRTAYVRKLEIGSNIQMSNPASAYVSRLYSTSSIKSTYYSNETLTTGNQSRGMTVYDKNAEVARENRKNTKHINVPNNTLRLEAVMKSRHVFKKVFGKELPTLENVLEQIDLLPDFWLEEYNKIDKEYKVSISSVSSKKDLFYYTITETGFDKCRYVIDYSYNLNRITKQDKSRYYKMVRDAFNLETDNTDDDIMKELDAKVYDLYHSYKPNKE